MSENLFYHLLPALYRQLDLAEGRPLEALLEVLDEERSRLEHDTDKLYAGWFAETADQAALLKIAGLFDLPHLLTRRAAIANTIGSRSRKGTLGALDRRLADASGWPALSAFAPPLSFDEPAAGTTLVTRVWRQPVYPVENAIPFRHEHHYTFHPMGVDQPLFHLPTPQPDLDRLLQLANMPAAITLHDPTLLAPTAITLNGQTLPITLADLSDPTSITLSSATPSAQVDPRTGRFLLDPPPASPAALSVSYAYAFTADVGGGPYPRAFVPPPDTPWLAYVLKDAPPALATQHIFSTLTDALNAFSQSPCQGTICFLDSATYTLPSTPLDTSTWACPRAAELGRHLTITAAAGECPCLTGTLQILAAGFPTTLTLDGVWIDGPILAGGLLTLQLYDSTLRPTGPAKLYGLQALPGPQPDLHIHLRNSICGPILLPPTCPGLLVESSIVQSIGDPAHPPPAPYPATLNRSTILGAITGVTLTEVASLTGQPPGFYVSTTFGSNEYARPIPALQPPGNHLPSSSGAFADAEHKLPFHQLEAALEECLPLQVPHRFSYET